jgi:hypothetical protein
MMKIKSRQRSASGEKKRLSYYSVKADFSVWPDLSNTLLAGYVGL